MKKEKFELILPDFGVSTLLEIRFNRNLLDQCLNSLNNFTDD